MLADAVHARSFHFGINAYGHLFFDLALLPLWLRRGPIGDHTIILTLRLVSWTFALATLVMLFGATRRFCGLLSAAIATALLALTPVFVRWSVISHPDMVQLFFITVCLYAIGRRLDRGAWGWTVAAAAAAGLAFASKYAGLFILPIVWGAEFVAPIAGPRVSDRAVAASRAVAGALAPALVVAGVLLSPAFVAAHLTVDGSIAPELVGRVEHLIQQLRLLLVRGGMALGALVAWWRPIERSARLRWMAVMLVTTSVVFVAVFTTVSPDSWRGFAFAKGLITEASFAELNDPEPTEWFRVLVGPYVLSRLLFIFVVAGAVAAVWRLRDSSQLMFEKVCLAWVLLFGAVVVLGMRQRPPHYLLPLLPAMLVLAVTGGRAVLAWAAARVPMSARLAGGLLAVAVVFELSHDAGRTLRMRREVLNEMETSAAVQVGGMLQCRVVPAATDSVRLLFVRAADVSARGADVGRDARPAAASDAGRRHHHSTDRESVPVGRSVHLLPGVEARSDAVPSRGDARRRPRVRAARIAERLERRRRRIRHRPVERVPMKMATACLEPGAVGVGPATYAVSRV